ncbi:MAG: nitrate/nitrite transporter NrtS [Myxococcota bacterium]
MAMEHAAQRASQAGVPGWLEVAVSGPVVRRAFGFFVVVGGVLILINHGDALLRGDVDGTRLVKMVLTPLVPYMVSTVSSVGAIRAAARERLDHDRAFHGAE